MSDNIYSQLLPSIKTRLKALDAILAKAQAFEEAKKLDASVLPNLRIAVDMFPLKRQVQIACDGAKGMAARLAGVEVPSWADEEQTLSELRARVTKTIDYMASFTAEQYAGSNARAITIPLRSGPLNLNGFDYATGFALPNIYFHVTTAYAILRQAGVEIGKMDFLGGR